MAETIPGPPAIHPALLRHTGFLVSRMGHVALKGFHERMASIGLHPRMWGALNVLAAEGPITQHELCKSMGIDPSTMVSVIDELEAQGLVERRPRPSDRRAREVHITEHGQAILAKGREQAKLAQEDLLAPLSAEERKQLHALLLRLALATSDA
jgi:DNA-binding MarR family transcriptional regulator